QLQTQNEPNGMVIRYYLKTASAAPPTIVITNAAGQELARLQGSANAGINQGVWNMRLGGGGRGGRAGGAAPAGVLPASANPIDQWAPLGDYTVTLTVAGKTLT